jgi:hypothetical protein
MLTENPNPEEEPFVEQRVRKLITHIGVKLTILAGVPALEQDRFLEGVRRALRRWEWDTAFHTRLGNPDRQLYQMLKNAEGLRKQLNKIHIASVIGNPNLFLNVGAKLQDALVETSLTEKPLGTDDMRKTIILLIDAIECALDGRTRSIGALPGIEGYPGLDALVFGLESAAYRTGGKFTAHRKLGPKGTLVKALNEIRNCLRNSDITHGEIKAKCLPPPNQHRIATYERLLRAARETRRKR